MFPNCYLSRDFRMKMLQRNPVLNIMNHCQTHSLALSIAAWNTIKKGATNDEIETRQLAGIPVLHAVPAGKRECSPPCILFYHGFTSSSLVYSYFAVALAQAGFRVVMPDRGTWRPI